MGPKRTGNTDSLTEQHRTRRSNRGFSDDMDFGRMRSPVALDSRNECFMHLMNEMING